MAAVFSSCCRCCGKAAEHDVESDVGLAEVLGSRGGQVAAAEVVRVFLAGSAAERNEPAEFVLEVAD